MSGWIRGCGGAGGGQEDVGRGRMVDGQMVGGRGSGRGKAGYERAILGSAGCLAEEEGQQNRAPCTYMCGGAWHLLRHGRYERRGKQHGPSFKTTIGRRCAAARRRHRGPEGVNRQQGIGWRKGSQPTNIGVNPI